MIEKPIDASRVEAGTSFESTVCIVGGGVAGLLLAYELAEARLDVVILESGGVEEISEVQDLSGGTNLGHPYFHLCRPQFRQVGGCANKWCIDLPGERQGPRLRPLDPIDFEKRSAVPNSGWPFGYPELAPYYERASSVIGFDSPSYGFDDHFPEARTSPIRPQLEKTGFDPIIYKFLYRSDFLSRTTERVNQSPSVRTIVKGTALELITNPEGTRVQAARCRALDGPEFLVKAQTFIVANGGIQAPRLLLCSRGANPTGLGNDHDLVGRYFMEHLHFWSGTWIPNEGDVPSLAPFTGFHTSDSGMPFLGKFAPSEASLVENELLNLNYQIIEMPLHEALWHRQLVWDESLDDFRDRDPLEARYRSFRKRLSHWMGKSRKRAFRIANMTEQSPNPDSRVTLSTDLDALGQPKADLDWRIAPGDFESFHRTKQLFKRGIESAGLGEVVIESKDGRPPSDVHGGDHLMGTTRMHDDPKQGVVDADLRVHGVANLYVNGPSVFPTGGYANPIYTLTALSIRLADHLRSRSLT